MDTNDHGLTMVFRFTDASSDVPDAYNFVLPTLQCGDKVGVVCMQRAGTLTVFHAANFAHASTINQRKPEPKCPSLGVACVQKMRSLNVSEKRLDVLENIVNFTLLERYHSQVADRS
jgi:hypothetical protein